MANNEIFKANQGSQFMQNMMTPFMASRNIVLDEKVFVKSFNLSYPVKKYKKVDGKQYYITYYLTKIEQLEKEVKNLGWSFVYEVNEIVGQKGENAVDQFVLVHDKLDVILYCYSGGMNNEDSVAFKAIGSNLAMDELAKKQHDMIHEVYEACLRACKKIAKETIERAKGAEYYIVGKDGYGHLNLINLNKVTCELSEELTNVSYPGIDAEKINSFFDESANGKLLLLHGKPGTGKTSYIRYLFTNHYEGSVVIINAEMLKKFTSSDFTVFAVNNLRNTLCLIEDAETILVARDENHTGRTSVVADLLNFTDGIMGDALNIKFIATFNTDLSEIDPAFLRKGRLHHVQSFEPHTKEQAAEFLKFKGSEGSIFVLEDKTYSLGELYGMLE